MVRLTGAGRDAVHSWVHRGRVRSVTVAGRHWIFEASIWIPGEGIGMTERAGDLLRFADRAPHDVLGVDAVCITTNGYIRSDSRGVMGRGFARQAKQQFPGIDRALGAHLIAKGNVVGILIPGNSFAPALVALPVKDTWDQPARLDLIDTSIRQLVALADQERWRRVALPRPGCGNGGLTWRVVKPLIAPLLDDRFVVVELPERF